MYEVKLTRYCRDKLKDIIEVLKGISEAEFNMGVWYEPDCIILATGSKSCGTVGCAIGHAVHAGKIKKLCIANNGGLRTLDGMKIGLMAVCHVLNIDYNDTVFLFSEEFYENPTKQVVSNRIKAYLKNPNAKQFKNFRMAGDAADVVDFPYTSV